MENKQEKQFLRKQMREKRAQLSKIECDERSAQIAEQLFQSAFYEAYNHICIYQAFRNEVSCEAICKQAWNDQKKVYVPVTDEQTKTMEFYEITPYTTWKKGAYGIAEPETISPDCVLNNTALILMPGLLFDTQRHRLGYGGGYYDKYLSAHTEHRTAALCYDFQVIDHTLPYEEHDRLPDYLVTEHHIYE